MAKQGREHDHSKYALWIDPNEVTPYEHNAKRHDEKQVKAIAKSIHRFGWQQDCVLTTDNVLVIGHGRWMAAKLLGCQIPYHIVGKTADELTEKDIKALRLADNKTAEGGIDFAALQRELEELADFQMDDFGFSFGTEEISFGEPEQAQPVFQQYGGSAAPYESDEGYREVQEPLSKEELEQYSGGSDQFLLKRRVIITYMPEQEGLVRELLGITEDDKMKIIYPVDELIGG